MLTVAQADKMTDKQLLALGQPALLKFMEEQLAADARDRQLDALLFYKPVSPQARQFHLSTAMQRVLTGGNGSGKSESNIVDMLIEMTGEVPMSLMDSYPTQKLRPPIAARLIIKSFTTTWENSIKPKLQWNKWTGMQDGKKGHWGWIPKRFLKNGKWEDSWSEKYRTLTLTNGSTMTVMSHEQDPAEQASASVHRIAIDEGPKHALYRENLFRIREGGYVSIAMTPPDEEAASWDASWVFDIYEKGLEGPQKDPDIDSFTLFTENNPYISQETVQKIAKGLSPTQREVRLHGHFMHLGGRIYQTYTDRDQFWCFTCNSICVLEHGLCMGCNNNNFAKFNHLINPIDHYYGLPSIFLMDPHPRKPVMMSWVGIDPYDDWWQLAELAVDNEPEVVAKKVKEVEQGLNLNVCYRIIDPNMGRSPAHNAGRRHVTVADEFAAVGLRCNDSVSDDFNVGRTRLQQRLKPDPRTRQPRLHIFNTCKTTNYQFNRFTWDEYSRYSADTKDPKQKPRDKDNDYPILLGYMSNLASTYSGLKLGSQPIRRFKRTAAY